MATLYIVGTPIGNLEDVTLRALRVLKEVDLIFAEDTRVTKKLLAHYGISTEVSRVHTRNEKLAAGKIINALNEGESVALVSDAGTPGISDPGSFIVRQVREALPETKLIAVPGPSALAAALSVAGLPTPGFVFMGFLPNKKGREKIFKEIAESKRAAVFYESPHRILRTLEKLAALLPERRITVARELTKVYEEVITGAAGELVNRFKRNPDKLRGEFVVIVQVAL